MMEVSNVSTNEFDEILLSAVRHGQTDFLENHLNTVDHPEIYVNRLYEETEEQKCTLLMIACLHGYDDLIRMLLNRFKPDLEIANDICLDEINSTQQLYLEVSVLWAVAAMGHFHLVRLFIEHGANVNYRTKTKSTPLRCVCRHGNLETIRYLIENGADVHARNDKNETNLMVSANYNHLDVVTYLIDEFNCDINATDDDGRSSLYDAVYCQSFPMAKYLLERGARNFRASIDQMSPLMWAAEKRLTTLADAIAPYCSILEQIEGKELLGSAFVYAPNGNHDLERALECFTEAIQRRLTHDLPKVQRTISMEVFDDRQECQTLKDLEILRLNPNLIYTEALLIRERLLGTSDKRYRASLTYRGAFLADSGLHHRALMLWMYELGLCQQHSISFDAIQVRETVSLISEMLSQSTTVPIDSLLTLLKWISEELGRNPGEFNRNFFTLCFLITIMAKVCSPFSISDSHYRTLGRQLYIINKHQHTTLHLGSSLLHLCLDEQTLVDDYHIEIMCR